VEQHDFFTFNFRALYFIFGSKERMTRGFVYDVNGNYSIV
jgi:hypothetical protein